MRPTFLGFESSKTAVFANQKSMDIVGNNLANIYSEGYTRQRADQVANTVGSYTSRYAVDNTTYSGLGTTVKGIQQIRDNRLDQAFRNEYATTGYYDQKSAMLEDLESVMQELDVGTDGNGYNIASAIEQVYESLQDYSTDVTSVTYANVAVASFTNVSSILNQLYAGLEESALEYKGQLQSDVSETNSIFTDIASLNESIRNSMIANGYSEQYGPNELLDQRNQLLDDLSKYGKVSISENDDGTIDVALGGHNVVKGTTSEKIIYLENTSGTVSLNWNSTGEIVNAGMGSLASAVEVLNGRGMAVQSSTESIERGYLYYKDKLNSFASMLAEVANNTIPDTFDANGNVTGYKQIFSADVGTGKASTMVPVTAANICISDELKKSSGYLITDKNDKNNVYVMDMIEQMFTSPHQFETTGDCFKGTFEEFVGDYLSTLGNDVSYNSTRLEASLKVLDEIQDSRDDVSGVSESEETSNMLMFNRSFQASAKMMTTMDSLLDVIINKMGV